MTSSIHRPTNRGQSARVEYLDAQALGGRPARLLHLDRREAQRRSGQRGYLAGEPDDRERVTAVRLDVDVQNDIAEQVGHRRAQRRVGGQDEDAVGVGGQPELVARAEHAVAHDAHLLGPLDAPVAGQDGARKGDRDPLPRCDVGGAAHDLERLAGADGHPGQRQPVGPGMTLDRQQLPDDDVRASPLPSARCR